MDQEHFLCRFFWAVLLWNTLMGTTVYGCCNPNVEGAHVCCHSRKDGKEGKASFPYSSASRIVVFGGHESWVREIRQKLPTVRFIDRTAAPNSNMIRNADIIWIQTNALSHPRFYKIVDEAKKYSVPIRYFSYASPIKCAEQLVRED